MKFYQDSEKLIFNISLLILLLRNNAAIQFFFSNFQYRELIFYLKLFLRFLPQNDHPMTVYVREGVDVDKHKSNSKQV